MFNQSKRLIFLFLILPLLLAGCTLPWKKKAQPSSLVFPGGAAEEAAPETAAAAVSTSQVKKFSDYGELAAWLAENSNPESVFFRSQARALADSVKLSESPAPVYSRTNNQVSGVDEADIIKTDGQYVYALVKSELLVIKVAPPGSSEIIAKIGFESRPQDILVSGSNLAVFGLDDQVASQPFFQKVGRYNPYAFFKVFDLSSPAQPKLVRDLKFEGSYQAARLIGDYVYFVTSMPGAYIANEPLVPRLVDDNSVVSANCQTGARCFQPDVYYFDIPYDVYDFTSLSAINIKDASEPVSGDIYLLSSGQELFVSDKNIYITYTQTVSEREIEQALRREIAAPLLSDADQQRLKDIESSPGHVLNKHEKAAKASQLLDRLIASLPGAEQKKISNDVLQGLEKRLVAEEARLERTIIHKIGVNGRQLEYLALGEVPGRLLNQFSMDEFSGYFRIATTRSPQESRLSDTAAPSYNNLYVLDKDLKIIGRLEKLATTERIYAVRFLGERAYIVTFKQTDPLFAISLADPTKPSVLNAIKVPGFSTYLHPIDNTGNKLFGLGRQTAENPDGSVKILGVKLSLYDFTDTAKPQELDSFLIGEADSDSIALEDHRAFLYSQEKNILVIPAVLREGGRLAFSGSLVFGIKDSRLELKGRIDHSAGGRYSQPDAWRGYDYYDNTAKRSLYINDYLLTLSNKFLKINSLSDLSEQKSLQLTSSEDDYIITPVPSPSAGEMPGQPAATSSSAAPTGADPVGSGEEGQLPAGASSTPLSP